MLRVGIDDQIFRRQQTGGITRYFCELSKGLRLLDAAEPLPLFDFSRSAAAAATFPGVRRLAVEDSRLGAGIFSVVNYPARRRLRRCDVVHYSYYDVRRLQAPKLVAAVSTVHDMIEEDAGLAAPAWFDKAAFAQASDVVFAVSHATRRALLHRLPIDPDAVVVTHLAAAPAFSRPTASPRGVPERYVLYVGQRSGYKDFLLLLRSWLAIRGRERKIGLVVVGGGAWSEAELAEIEGAGTPEDLIRLDASEAALPGLYACAEVLVQSSRAEGFGLPVLEAMAAGTAVLAADLEVTREVGGEALEFFTAGDSESLAVGLLHLTQDAAHRNALIRMGRRKAADFSWERTAEQTAKGYELARERFRDGRG